MSSLKKHRSLGFTLLELLVVIAIIAVATAGVGLAMRGTEQSALEREAQRLAVLFESARAQSRASGAAVVWRTTPDGFKFEGLPAGTLPERWLAEGTTTNGISTVQLGPEPMIGPQAVELVAAHLQPGQVTKTVRISTDGLRPFAVAIQGQP
jgi:general secretion pathway protein H